MIRSLTLAVVLLPALAGTASAQSDTPHPNYPEVFYIHGALGVGLSLFNSSDAEQTLRDQFSLPIEISNAGVDFAYSLRLGYRNIAQAEYRIQKGVGQKIYWDQGQTGTDLVGRIEVEENLDSQEWLLKLNPFFPLIEDRSIGFFLVYGQGTAEYFGDLGIDFDDGDKKIFGLEFTKLFRWYAASVSVEYHDISFGSYADEDTRPFDGAWDATNWIIQGSFSAGFGE